MSLIISISIYESEWLKKYSPTNEVQYTIAREVQLVLSYVLLNPEIVLTAGAWCTVPIIVFMNSPWAQILKAKMVNRTTTLEWAGN